MTLEARVQRLQSLAEDPDVDEGVLNTEATDIGSDLEGLTLLVERCSRSPNTLLVRAVTFPLAGAAFKLAAAGPRISSVVLHFVREAGLRSSDVGTLVTSASALTNLSVSGLLAADGDQSQVLLDFITRCLEFRHTIVQAGALQLLAHLLATDQIDSALPATARTQLRRRVQWIASESGAEFASELADLRDLLEQA